MEAVMGWLYKKFAERMWWEAFQRNDMKDARKWLWRSL